MEKVKRVKKRKLNWKRILILLLILYLIAMLLYTFFTMPIKNIYIKGTNLLTDNDIIEVANLKDYPAIFKISKSKLKKEISSLELVEDVDIKKTITGKLTITITEARPLFFNRTTNKVVLSNNKEVENNNYLGIPTLINRVPTDILSDFITALSEIDHDIIKMINEIEYDPNISNDITIDEYRFLLRMNDSNHVYVNIINMERLNDYESVFATIGDLRGTVYLDSYNADNIIFEAFGSDTEEETNTGGEIKDETEN
ncbi:MAG TPA: FtsQ-type POTRA domain-containing protein [Candidatus Caccenecus avistercoris]|nr:FtsQ-type POTRA domain-containing protein [Candidatus Caccenecus avistercoris]